MHKPDLQSNPTLQDVQAYVAQTIRERGFDKQSLQAELLMLCEEVGELAKATRKFSGVRLATDSKQPEIADELADVLWMTVCVANRLGIDLAQALRGKEAKNKRRQWQ